MGNPRRYGLQLPLLCQPRWLGLPTLYVAQALAGCVSLLHTVVQASILELIREVPRSVPYMHGYSWIMVSWRWHWAGGIALHIVACIVTVLPNAVPITEERHFLE